MVISIKTVYETVYIVSLDFDFESYSNAGEYSVFGAWAVYFSFGTSYEVNIIQLLTFMEVNTGLY